MTSVAGILVEYQALIVSVAYFVALVVVAVAEEFRRLRASGPDTAQRWFSNLSLALAGAVMWKALVPLPMLAFAGYWQGEGRGLLPLVTLPTLAIMMLGWLALDASRYLLHYLLHRLPLLWQVHRVHHTDTDYDFTTGLRFHPLEHVITIAWQFTVLALLGVPSIVLALYEVVAALVAVWAHGNLRVPPKVDRICRGVVVTPDFHRVHHSILPAETFSNFSAVSPWWDRLFGTAIEYPRDAPATMDIGLPEHRSRAEQGLWCLLKQPFVVPLQPFVKPGSTLG